MGAHNEYGKQAEELAAKLLLQKGYRILERNWIFGKNEIDILAEFQQELIVVEVKARASNYFSQPEDAVNNQKRKRIVAAANEYVLVYELDWPVRYDIVAITGELAQPQVEHIEDAFIPPLS